MEDTLSSVDRINDLPDEVLLHILSSMSTKEAAPTFMLSKRWNSLWACMPCLKFDYREFLPKNNHLSYCEEGDQLSDSEFLQEGDRLSMDGNAKFIRFITGVLRHRGSTPVDKFELVYGKNQRYTDTPPVEFVDRIVLDIKDLINQKYTDPVMEWVDHIVVNCKPRVLTLDIENYYRIPRSVFSCESIEEMELILLGSGYNGISLPSKIYLPILKKLTIVGAVLDESFCDKLFSGSCLLENFVLHSCVYMLDSTLRISSSSLKHFSLRSCDECEDVQIDTPSLITLEVKSNENGRIHVKNLMSLVNARVEIYGRDLYNARGYLKHISALANVTTLDLTLSSHVMKKNLEKQLFSFPTFINLKTLEIGKWCMDYDFDLVAAFLEHSPNLQMLKLFHIESCGSNQGTIVRDTIFLKEYLQTVVIDPKHWGNVANTKDESVDLLVKQLHASVRTIGEIIIMKSRSNLLDDFFDLDDAFLDSDGAWYDSDDAFA